ncbi:hypothetical protein VP01_1327g4 [Puccinia sorghi]|uniref:Thioredoxin domain-containing protein n=1 Tax=Puccinia sorghi TaxID=27349 RepID=A0A0L6VN44_9BASI|nr:hypothetical protein VP01_1327g4 [Puccinia sorghi]
MQVNLANVLQYHALDALGTSHNNPKNDPSSPFLVYVWKSADNPFRQAPWNISRIPTVLKLGSAAAATTANADIILDHHDKLVEKDTIDFKKLLDFLS